jgi:hypothetical protein
VTSVPFEPLTPVAHDSVWCPVLQHHGHVIANQNTKPLI